MLQKDARRKDIIVTEEAVMRLVDFRLQMLPMETLHQDGAEMEMEMVST